MNLMNMNIETDEFRIIYDNLMKGADCWRAKVMEALKLYVYMEEEVELDAIMIMLRVIGKKGNAMESPNVDLLCCIGFYVIY